MLKKLDQEYFLKVHELLPRIKEDQFLDLLNGNCIFGVFDDDKFVGILIYTVFWEKLPFIQHLIIDERERNKGYGTKAILEWENLMKEKEYKMVLLSTQVDEKAQFLYRKLGYKDCGGISFIDTPFDQPLELFLYKRIDRH